MDVAQLPGWKKDQHLDAFRCFLSSCSAHARGVDQARPAVKTPTQLARVFELGNKMREQISTQQDARHFFESHFTALPIGPTCSKSERNLAGECFFTGFFEPVVPASSVPVSGFTEPIYRLPDPSAMTLTRKQIREGALRGKGLEIAYVKDSWSAFVIHVQGAACLEFASGKKVRLTYAGKNQHPYVSIGKRLIENNCLPKGADFSVLQKYMDEVGRNGQSVEEILDQNPSFIFFTVTDQKENEGPVASAGVSLHTLRSIAIDNSIYSYGLPFWMDLSRTVSAFNDTVLTKPRLMIAQETGSAIRGEGRVDIFCGSGPEAGTLAGKIRHKGQLFVLQPRLL